VPKPTLAGDEMAEQKTRVLSSRYIVFVNLLTWLALPIWGCTSAKTEPVQVSPKKSAMIGAVAETGWDGVAALTINYPGTGHVGSFCTGTLIAPQWVLTAAHCLTEHEGQSIWPRITRMYFGTDARETTDGSDPPGTLVQADGFILHPQYDPLYFDNDIALVHLEKPATGIPVYPMNTLTLGSNAVGLSIFAVGFGVSDATNKTGSGIKRSGYMQVAQVPAGQSTITSEYQGTAVCYGDSGGPTFLSVSGQAVVAGVNSVTHAPDCTSYHTAMRVDSYVSWIEGHMASGAPSCSGQSNSCFCAAACKSGGGCNNSVCQTKSCADLTTCISGCGQNDENCAVDCYFSTTTDGQQAYDAWNHCVQNNCANAADQQGCMNTYCTKEIDTCYGITKCTITGGSCGPGMSCYPSQNGTSVCIASSEVGLHQPCNPVPGSGNPVSCDDGMLCSYQPQGPICLQLCSTVSDCGSGEECQKPAFKSLPDVGVCVPPPSVTQDAGVPSTDQGLPPNFDGSIPHSDGMIVPPNSDAGVGLIDGSIDDPPTPGGGCQLDSAHSSSALPSSILWLLALGLLALRRRPDATH
jgi:hypothetical protein